jgi:hypothetical protein
VAITLGKDVTVSVGGTVASARSATFSYSVNTIDIGEYGVRTAAVYPVSYTGSVSLEFNDASDFGALYSMITDGAEITVSGGAGSWSFPAVVTGASESDPIDGVATFTVEAQMTRSGTRAV